MGLPTLHKRFTCLIFLLVALLCLSGCDDSSNSRTSSDSPANKSLEYKIAYIDSVKSDSSLKDDDARINRIRYLLESISQQTGDTKEHIGDVTVGATKTIHDQYGKDISNAEFLEQARDFVENMPKKTKLDYAHAATLLVLTYAH